MTRRFASLIKPLTKPFLAVALLVPLAGCAVYADPAYPGYYGAPSVHYSYNVAPAPRPYWRPAPRPYWHRPHWNRPRWNRYN
ncbi:MAG: hypothetical protein IT557_00855 [Alphaproteobacteria bacterium]|nr:hypothetical protein [Alphaproteobacteria bacterium]